MKKKWATDQSCICKEVTTYLQNPHFRTLQSF
jgi:hypothetical protein